MTIDIIVILVYFAFLMSIGWLFRTFSNSTSDFFKGGGKMLWWMVGATAFMTQFSAWSFTGAAGKAYSDGFAILATFLGNAVGYFGNYLFFAAKSRQMRVVTPIEGVRLRFGKVNEQVFTLAAVPSSTISAGIWLNSLAIFVSAVFGISIETTIYVTGAIVVLMSVTGGAWAVIASDFLQMVIIMAVSFVASVVAITKAGGVSTILETGLPEASPFSATGHTYFAIFVVWVIASFAKQFLSTNNMIDSYRYMCAKDTKNARKAALLACILMFVGPFIWFVPAWFMAGPGQVFAGQIEELGKDATYYVFIKNYLPTGMVGLMMSAMFAATMSSMDSALNRNAGIYVRNVYRVFVNKEATEEKMIKVGKTTTLLLGVCIILLAQFISSLNNLDLFSLMQTVSSLIVLPVLIPTFFGYIVKNTPDWSAWATLIVGAGVSYFVTIIEQPWIEAILGTTITSAEFSDMKSLTLGVLLHACITLPFFICSKYFFKGFSEERQKEYDLFFSNINTEVVSEDDDEEANASDNNQRNMLGKLLSLAGGAITLLVVMPQETFSSRLVFLAVGAIVLIAGLALVYSSKPKALTTENQEQ
ncbi:MAG: transporter [Clostridia bacterium]